MATFESLREGTYSGETPEVHTEPQPLAERLMAFEAGELEDLNEVVDLFQELVNSGLAWRLQGFYGRTAQDLIEAGLVIPPGSDLRPFTIRWTDPEGDTWTFRPNLNRSERAWFRNRYREERVLPTGRDDEWYTPKAVVVSEFLEPDHEATHDGAGERWDVV